MTAPSLHLVTGAEPAPTLAFPRQQKRSERFQIMTAKGAVIWGKCNILNRDDALQIARDAQHTFPGCYVERVLETVTVQTVWAPENSQSQGAR